MTPETRHHILALCDRLSDTCGVQWDRGTNPDGQYALYGWIARPGDARDFVVLQFGPEDDGGAWIGWVTSSAEHSPHIHTAAQQAPFTTYGSDRHADIACQPIRDLFPVRDVTPWQE
jgi:hypothetical protein